MDSIITQNLDTAQPKSEKEIEHYTSDEPASLQSYNDKLNNIANEIEK